MPSVVYKWQARPRKKEHQFNSTRPSTRSQHIEIQAAEIFPKVNSTAASQSLSFLSYFGSQDVKDTHPGSPIRIGRFSHSVLGHRPDCNSTLVRFGHPADLYVDWYRGRQFWYKSQEWETVGWIVTLWNLSLADAS